MRVQKTAVFVALWVLTGIVGCAVGAERKSQNSNGLPTPMPAPAKRDGLTPYAVAFWDEERGLLTGQSGCPVQCGDYVIALTEDGGLHWREVYRGTDRIGNLSTVPGGAWASTVKGLLKSSDEGQTWEAVSAGYAEPAFVSGEIGWTLVATEEDRWNIESHIFSTADGGKTWNRVNSPCVGRLTGTGAIRPSK